MRNRHQTFFRRNKVFSRPQISTVYVNVNKVDAFHFAWPCGSAYEISMIESLKRHDLEDVLRFYAQAGLDYALSEEPIDQFAAFETQRQAQVAAFVAPAPNQNAPTAPRIAAPAGRPVAIPDDAAIDEAKRLAEACNSIGDIADALVEFEGCGLKFTAKNLVCADGNANAPVMFVSDVPGREDDLEGRLFSGPVGLLFDRMLASIGLNRERAYLGAMIPWRPPGNRMPTAFEVEVCRPFIERRIEIAAPKLLVMLGDLPARTLLNSNESILRIRGQWRDYSAVRAATIPTLSMLHPAYLMKQPMQKRLAWGDLLDLKERLDAT